MTDAEAGGLPSAAQAERERLSVLHRLLTQVRGDVEAGRASVPDDGGSFWRSTAQREYARGLGELRHLLGHAVATLDDAIACAETAIRRIDLHLNDMIGAARG
ncbi:hypothetical protein OSC27_10965 [Microbacterium sp. STN6]|uniref:hypothetical protein n=1 Tax=Microbacterium sp. STN6 TaxID=2995588 RepID=UPI002260936F|nr:hypothetical protein [Microbacterium sp. STN6]MCX7522794.1 hypothetical protein [Microbacterium sp. STN6]